MKLKEFFDETIREILLKLWQGLAEMVHGEDGYFNWQKIVRLFGQFLDDALLDADKPKVDNIINTLGLNNFVINMRNYWKKIPAQVRNILVKTLEEHTNKIEFKILDDDGNSFTTGDIGGPWNSVLNFEAKPELNMYLQALQENADVVKALKIPCPADERILNVGVQGELSVGAQASLPIKFPTYFSVSVDAGATVKGKLELDYYYHNEGSDLFIKALSDNLSHIPAPWDAVHVENDMRHQLSAVKLSVIGSLQTHLGMGVGFVWGTNVSVKNQSLNLNTDVQIGAGINVGYQTDLSLMGSWCALVKPYTGDMASLGILNHDPILLYFKLEKDKSKTTTNTFTLDANAGVSGLDKVGDAVIKKYMPDASGLLKELDTYVNLGDYLKERVVTEFNELLGTGLGGDSEEFKKTLVSILVGDAQASELSEVIGDAAKKVINENLEILLKIPDDAGDTVLKKIADILDLKGTIKDKLIAVAKNKMNGFLKSISDKLNNHLKKLIDENKTQRTTFFKPLEAFGADLKGLSENISETSKKLIGPLIEYLKDYQALRQKITKTIAASKRLNLGVSLKRMVESGTSSSAMLEFVLDITNPKVREYYKEMMVGNFKNALTAARLNAFASTGVSILGGLLKEMVSHKVTSDITVNLLGIKVSSQIVKRSEVHVELDVSGNVIMAESETEFMRQVAGFGETKSIQFLNHFELPTVAPKPGEPPTLKILNSGLNILYKDKTFKRKELEAYVGSFGWKNLVSPDSKAKLLAKYAELHPDHKGEEDLSKSVEIGLRMPLNSDDIEVLMERSNPTIFNFAVQNQIDSYFYENREHYSDFVDVLNRWNNCEGANLTDLQQISKLEPYYGDKSKKAQYGHILFHEHQTAEDRRIFDLSKYINDKNLTKEGAIKKVKNCIDFGIHVGDNAVNLISIINNLKQAAQMIVNESISLDVKTIINGYNNEMNKHLKSWLKIKGLGAAIGLQNEAIPAITRAFIATIANLCNIGGDGKPCLIMTVKWPKRGDDIELY